MKHFWTYIMTFTLTSGSLAQAQFIVAHRGASFDAPENTMAAFQEAWKQGADAIEADFSVTADGKVVCMHDKTTSRTTGETTNLEIGISTYEQLQNLDVGSWKDPKFAGEKIPQLSDVLAIVPEGKKIFIEVKCGPEIVIPMKEALDASTLDPAQVYIITFNKDVVQACREQMPAYKVNWLTSYKDPDGIGNWIPSVPEIVRTLQEIEATGFGSQANDQVVTQDFVNAVSQGAGVEFHVWTVNTAEQAEYYQSLGVTSITTDRPALIREALAE